MTDESTKTIWLADSTHPKEAEKLREGLREVMDPELGLNIIELGLVRDAVIEDDNLRIKMIMTTPFCPYGPALLEMTREKAQSASGMETHIELGHQMWEPSMMEEGAGADWGLF
ncbi:MAG: iron-sulfur cluster assembly protein [Anaerolineales bacterium]|jgi:metal-sulfur cluster biosynthetic enzyme